MHLPQSRGASARLHRMRRDVRGWCCGRRADRRALRSDVRRRAIVAVDASRAATGDWQRRGCLGTLHILCVASRHVVLLCCLLDGSRRRGCGGRTGVDMGLGGNATCLRAIGPCAVAEGPQASTAADQTQAPRPWQRWRHNLQVHGADVVDNYANDAHRSRRPEFIPSRPGGGGGGRQEQGRAQDQTRIAHEPSGPTLSARRPAESDKGRTGTGGGRKGGRRGRRGRRTQGTSDAKNEYGNRDRRKREYGQSRAQTQGEIGTIGIIKPSGSRMAATDAELWRDGRGREGGGGK
jgi:hypothetical protein